MTYRVSRTPKQLQGIYKLDLLLLDKATFKIFPGDRTEMRCICPYCEGKGKNLAGEKGRKVMATASIYKPKNGEGYCFKCLAFKEFRNSMYQLAKDHFSNGKAVADWYATYRWEMLDRAAGYGWSCPLPKKVAKSFADARADKCRSKKDRAAPQGL